MSPRGKEVILREKLSTEKIEDIGMTVVVNKKGGGKGGSFSSIEDFSF